MTRKKLLILAELVVLVFVIPTACFCGLIAGCIDVVRSWFNKVPLFS